MSGVGREPEVRRLVHDYMHVNRNAVFSQRLTLHRCDLLVDWPAGQRVFQSVEIDFIGGCDLSETMKGSREKKKVFDRTELCQQETVAVLWLRSKSNKVVQVVACAPTRNESACMSLNYSKI